MARAPGPFFFLAATSLWATLLVPGAAADITTTLDSLWSCTTATDGITDGERTQTEIGPGRVGGSGQRDSLRLTSAIASNAADVVGNYPECES